MKHDNAINGNCRNQQARTKNSTHTIPVLVNGLTSMDISTKDNYHEPKSSSQQNREHNIIIIGNSHARGAASNVKHNLNDNYRSSGFVRPGANIDRLISSMTENIKHLMSNDIIVFWRGTNDVSKNNSQDALKHITNIVKVNSRTNIILMCVPHRHDLPEWSCVNSEVKAFNRKLVKLMKPYKHVTVVKVDPDRKFFTRQGLHMNNLGTEKIAFKIASVVTKIFRKQEEINGLYWKNECEVNVSDGPNEDNIIIQEDPKATPSTTVSVEALMMQLKVNRYIRDLEHPKDKRNPQQ
jgi:lysophospholipase L1-like esterase